MEKLALYNRVTGEIHTDLWQAIDYYQLFEYVINDWFDIQDIMNELNEYDTGHDFDLICINE